MKENVINEKSMSLAVRIVHLYEYLVNNKKEKILSKQLLRSGTSIGANIRESKNAQSDKDFIAKLYIALKEADETIYWIELLHLCNYLTDHEFNSIHSDVSEVTYILISIIKTKKTNMKKKKKSSNKAKS